MKSIFWRYLIVMVALLLASFLISGTVFMWRTYTITVESTQAQLELKTRNLATTTILLAQNDAPATRKLFSRVFTQIFDEGANAIICDMNGSLELYVDRDGIREDRKSVV